MPVIGQKARGNFSCPSRATTCKSTSTYKRLRCSSEIWKRETCYINDKGGSPFRRIGPCTQLCCCATVGLGGSGSEEIPRCSQGCNAQTPRATRFRHAVYIWLQGPRQTNNQISWSEIAVCICSFVSTFRQSNLAPREEACAGLSLCFIIQGLPC